MQRKTEAMRFPERLWFHLEQDREARAAVRSADLVVALDNRAVYSAWRIAQFRRQPEVCFGIAAGLRALEKRREPGGAQLPEHVPGPLTVATDGLRRRVRTLPADLLRNATGPLALRSRVGARAWRAAVSAPGVPDTLRMTATEQVIEGMWLAGRQSGALTTARAAAGKLADPAMKPACWTTSRPGSSGTATPRPTSPRRSRPIWTWPTPSTPPVTGEPPPTPCCTP